MLLTFILKDAAENMVLETVEPYPYSEDRAREIRGFYLSCIGDGLILDDGFFSLQTQEDPPFWTGVIMLFVGIFLLPDVEAYPLVRRLTTLCKWFFRRAPYEKQSEKGR